VDAATRQGQEFVAAPNYEASSISSSFDKHLNVIANLCPNAVDSNTIHQMSCDLLKPHDPLPIGLYGNRSVTSF
jgi:hypothetical protein